MEDIVRLKMRVQELERKIAKLKAHEKNLEKSRDMESIGYHSLIPRLEKELEAARAKYERQVTKSQAKKPPLKPTKDRTITRHLRDHVERKPVPSRSHASPETESRIFIRRAMLLFIWIIILVMVLAVLKYGS